MFVFRDWRVLTWLSVVVLMSSVLFLAFFKGSDGVTSVYSPYKSSTVFPVVEQINYSLYQGVAAGSDVDALRAWLNNVGSLAADAVQIRKSEGAVDTDPLLTGFRAVESSVTAGKAALGDKEISQFSIRRNTVAAVTYLTALSQGRSVPVFYNQLVPVSTAPPQAGAVTVPPSPESKQWPFIKGETQ